MNRLSETLVPEQAADDAQIMRLAQRDPALFAPLYERYVGRVYAYCARRCGSRQEAEDLCSQVFTRALAGLHTYAGGNVAAWLFRIAHRVVANHYRSRQVLVAVDDFEVPDDSMREAVDRADDGRILGELIAALPDDQRDLLLLAIDGGLTSEEAGAALGKSAGAVRVQLHRIIKGLRERYLTATGAR